MMAKEQENSREGKQCSFKDCEVLILPHWEQRSGTNFTYWVDLSTANKSFVHRHNHEGFKGFTGHRHTSSNGSNASPELSRLVLGELESGGATEASLAIAQVLLQLASGKHGAAAIQALDRLAIRLGEMPPTMNKPGRNQTCPLCNRTPTGKMHITISPGPAREQVELMADLMDSIEDEEPGSSAPYRSDGE